MADTRTTRLAVLIDADNTSARIAGLLFDEIAKLGEASVRRIYGDFSSPRLRGWTDILAKHAILPQQQFAYVSGKNASDIALVIDAMDLMHSGRFDGFCLVSSDSDFTRLAARLRENGVDVYGFGESKTPESFRQACLRFIYTENLVPSPPAGAEAPAAGSARPVAGLGAARDILREVFAIAESDDEADDGWITLSTLGKQIYNRYPDFDARTFGQKKLSDLVGASGLFELGKTAGGELRVRRQAAPKRPAAGGDAATPAAPKGEPAPARRRRTAKG